MFLFFTFWTVLLLHVYLPSSLTSTWTTSWSNWKRHGVFSSSLGTNLTTYSKFRDQG